ncbi:MAG: DHH family phosphoesterase [Candidatus Odinarchaeum yellowstonii]|uniref:DHH family phosphoesterase n=1 Tax=Odinarchaeota yellowstonii (strain LCB_4) TaxID=1841599 RepID=A0AAF0D190_ODILC|nr:MAG: DHH family phosphoesterase [Candidatus Odinarchaeum yellowstonii]
MSSSRYYSLLRSADSISGHIRDLISENKFFQIISHIDADGISAAGIISKALARENARFSVRIIKRLTVNEIKALSLNCENKAYFLLDMGSGLFEDIFQLLQDKTTVFIVDHHETSAHQESDAILELNPHLHGLNGSSEVSGAGASYILAKSLDKRNMDLSPLALVGAVGDVQDKGNQRTFTGLNNDIILSDAVNLNLVKVVKDILLFGSETRPIHLALKYTSDPFIEGLTGDEDKCIAFLTNLNIQLKKDGDWRTLSDLNQEEKVKLYSALVTYMLQIGYDTKVAEQLIGTKYIITSEEEGSTLRDIREYAYTLNACSRLGYPGLAVSLCLGDRSKPLLEAQTVINDYRQRISQYISWLKEPGRIKETGWLKIIHGEDVIDDRMIATIASIYSRITAQSENKVLVCFAYKNEGDGIKVSARGTDELVKKGLNLNQALKKTLGEMGLTENEAGGHDIAAGAEIPVGSEETFISYLNKIIRSQIGEV